MLSRLRPRRRASEIFSFDGDPGAAALGFLQAQGLPTDPRYYALMHRALADQSSRATYAVFEVLERDGRLSLADADAILALIDPEPADAQEKHEAEHQQLRLQTLQLADLAADAAAATGKFGRDLSAGLEQVDRSAGSIDALIVAMVERTQATEQQLAQAVEQIDQLRDEVAAARSDAARDELTGLLNRRGIMDVLGELGDGAHSIAICDVDRFKAINDGHGHAVGDRVLGVVASALENGCRPHLVGRWGGEEFLLLFRNTDPAAAAELVDDVRLELSSRRLRVRENGASLGVVTFSAGVTALCGDFEQALRAADALLYRAKTEGRDRVFCANTENEL
jgi:diguanylate cyclase